MCCYNCDCDALNRSAIAEVAVQKKYIDELANTSSKEFKEFVADFKTQMTPFYTKKIKHFVDITNIILSVNVKHDIIVEIPNNQVDVVYDEIFKQVEEALTTVQNCSVGDDQNCPNFTISDTSASQTKLDTTEFCDKATADFPEGYQQYYSSATVSGKLTCVTACHQSHPKPKLCENRGTCAVSKNGPTCYCLHTDENWYLGEDCKLQVSKGGVYAGIGVVLVALILAIAVLLVYVFINRRKMKRNNDNKEELVNQWLDDDFEWSASRPSTSHSDHRMNSDNLGYAHENRYSQHYSTQPSASPQQHIPPGYYHNNQPPWINSSIKGLLNKKKRAFKNNNQKELRSAQRELKVHLQEAKESYSKNVEQTLKEKNIREVCNGMKTITGYMQRTDSATDGDVERANEFNEFIFYNRFDFPVQVSAAPVDTSSTLALTSASAFLVINNSPPSPFVIHALLLQANSTVNTAPASHLTSSDLTCSTTPPPPHRPCTPSPQT
ncbi:hypothetical protein NFI96_001110, partial [Prochilodus magdalenae]